MPSRARVIAAIVSWGPFSYQVALVEPANPELDMLRARIAQSGLTTHQQTLAIEQFRVAEAIHAKRHAPLIALRRAISAVCDMQSEYLKSLDASLLRSVSLRSLALGIGMSSLELGNAIRNLYIRVPQTHVLVDSLVGPVGPSEGALGYIKPTFLIPTDEPRQDASFNELVSIFRQGRQSILDPVLAVEDPLRPGYGLVCDGNHRVAAAFKCRTQVRIRILKSKGDLESLRVGTVGEMARHFSLDRFVDRCREQSTSIGLYAGGWQEYLARMEG